MNPVFFLLYLINGSQSDAHKTTSQLSEYRTTKTACTIQDYRAGVRGGYWRGRGIVSGAPVWASWADQRLRHRDEFLDVALEVKSSADRASR